MEKSIVQMENLKSNVEGKMKGPNLQIRNQDHAKGWG